MPVLETERLAIRPFVVSDLDVIHRILDVELAAVNVGTEGPKMLQVRRRWLDWAVLNYEQLAALNQPPYGDRAVIVKATKELIGAVGLVPSFNLFERLPGLRPEGAERPAALYTPEFGLYYAISVKHQRQGYAVEAAGAMMRYAFTELHVKRIVATTTYDNAASVGVMRRLGMRVERNPYPDPPWLQLVGILEQPAS